MNTERQLYRPERAALFQHRATPYEQYGQRPINNMRNAL